MKSGTTLDFIKKLEARLQQPLPGREAQFIMAASHKGRKEFDWEYDNPPVQSSVLLMLFERDSRIYFPLIQRPHYNGIHSGQIALPGGKEEKSDGSRLVTALRETNEEIGIKTDEVTILGVLSKLYVQASNYEVLPVVGFYPKTPVYNPDPKEVNQVVECTIEHLLWKDTRKEKEMLIRDKYLIKAPFFDISGHVVWGATAMILSEFVEIIKNINR